MSRSTCKIKGLKYPSADKITSRISTLRRSMACTLMHREACSPEQEEKWAKFFGDKTCAYCGRPATHLDHLYPMVRDNEPTGYGTDPNNLVPCCEKCNRSKGNMNWEDFMQSENCDHTPKPNKSLQVSKKERIQTITDFQNVMKAKDKYLDATVKQQWKERWNALEEELKKTEAMLLDMKSQIYGNCASGNQSGIPTTKSGSAGTATTPHGATGTRDRSKYIFNSKPYGKGPLLVALVEKYLEDNPVADAKELKDKFSLTLSSKPAIMLSSEVPKSWTDRVHGCSLLGGIIVYINKQVKLGDMDAILRIANELGYVVDKA